MTDYSVFEKRMKLSVESDGKYYPAEVKAVSKTGVKICFVGYVGDEWVQADRIRSKLLQKAAPKQSGGKSGVQTGKDAGAGALGKMTSYKGCVLAEYIWLDAHQTPRSKTKVLTARPTKISDLPVWNYDGSSTEQAEGGNSEINIKPRAIFDDPFRGYPHVLVMTDAYNAWDDKPAIGNTRADCAELHETYKKHDAWYGIEQEYTLMKPGKVGAAPTVPYGFNADGSAPAAQGPYYTGAGTGIAIGRPVADEHLVKCLKAGVKITGINAEVILVL